MHLGIYPTTLELRFIVGVVGLITEQSPLSTRLTQSSLLVAFRAFDSC